MSETNPDDPPEGETEPEDELPPENGHFEDNTTTASRTRAWWLSTVGTILLILSFVGLYSVVTIHGYEFPGGQPTRAFIIAFLLSVLYIVGPSGVDSLRKLFGKE